MLVGSHCDTVKPTILLHPYYKSVNLHKNYGLISFPVLSSLFSSSFPPHSFLFCYFFSILLPDAPFTHHCSFSNPAGDPRLLLQDKPHHKDSTGAPHTLIISFPQPPTALLACPGLSLVQPQPQPPPWHPPAPTLYFPPGDDVHISMYSMVLVLWCICTCACCSPVVQVCFSGSTTQYCPPPTPGNLYSRSQQPTPLPLTWSDTLPALAASTW